MMAVEIIAGFAGVWWLAVLALPIFSEFHDVREIF